MGGSAPTRFSISPTIALIDDGPERAAAICEALLAAGRHEVVIVPTGPGLARRIAAIRGQPSAPA